jgi:ABC-type Fe2+-enterobactin transport system substrate-binding protein
MAPPATAVKQPVRARSRRVVDPPARPSSAAELDAAAAEIERRMVLIGTDEMARYLQDHLGQKLTAYLAGLKDAKSVGQWAQGKSEPPAITRERLRAAFHATSLFLLAYSDQAAQGWFFGANSALDDRAPAAVLRTAETPDEMALVAPLARAFVRGAH